MARFVGWMFCGLALAGCQAQNPYALFGPNRVPTPGTSGPAPYYPPTASTTPTNSSAPASSTRPSVSVSSPSTTPAAVATAPAGEEPIRIVENPDPAVRTATAPPSRGSTAPAIPARDKSSSTQRSGGDVAPASFLTPASGASPASGQWKLR